MRYLEISEDFLRKCKKERRKWISNTSDIPQVQ